MHISGVDDVSLTWGDGLRWDDRRQRLYLADCATQTLHWLENGHPPVQSMALPSLPTGMALAEDGRAVIAFDDGLHVVDPDGGTTDLLAEYPEALGSRANDLNADGEGGLVTGTLNLASGPGSYWRYATDTGWVQLDDGIGNANGPVVIDLDGERTLVFADTHARVLYAYPYEGGAVGQRRVFANTEELAGMPDGACADDQGGVWSCVLGSGKLARYTTGGLQGTIDTGVELPSDVTFGGPDLDRMYFVSIALDIFGTGISSPDAGRLMAIEDSGYRGLPEHRFLL